jgi:pyrroline-5-carboxylate reductase
MIDKKVGIIGYGSMGSMLVKGLIESNNIELSNLFVSTRTKTKLGNLKNNNISICSSNKELAKNCDLIFICVKPAEIKNLLNEIKNGLTSDKHLISIAGSLTTANIEKKYYGKISRVIPTLISEIREGITLICHNSKVTKEDKIILEELLGSFSRVKNIPENDFSFISELTSCAPGLIASIFKEYVNSALQYSNINKNEINEIVIKTLYGVAKLFSEYNFNFDETIKRVATKGGTTEAGVEVIERKIPEVFDEMFKKMIERQNSRKQKIDEQFSS